MTQQVDNLLKAPNPFDVASLRLDPSYAESVGVRKLLTTVPVRKPNKQDFVRVQSRPLLPAESSRDHRA
jgi:hypothetical protein